MNEFQVDITADVIGLNTSLLMKLINQTHDLLLPPPPLREEEQQKQ